MGGKDKAILIEYTPPYGGVLVTVVTTDNPYSVQMWKLRLPLVNKVGDIWLIWPDLIVCRVVWQNVAIFRTSMESLAKSDVSFCLALSSEGRLRLREDHDYYYQVQGELNITKRQLCYFVGERTEERSPLVSLPVTTWLFYSLVTNRVPLRSHTERRTLLGPSDVSLATGLSQVISSVFLSMQIKHQICFTFPSGNWYNYICINQRYFLRFRNIFILSAGNIFWRTDGMSRIYPRMSSPGSPRRCGLGWGERERETIVEKTSWSFCDDKLVSTCSDQTAGSRESIV